MVYMLSALIPLFHELPLTAVTMLYRRGKPYVTHLATQLGTSLQFSVSHDGDWVALCSAHHRIGCDVVCQRAANVSAAKMLAGMWRNGHITPNEWDTIRSHPRLRDRLQYFYRIWACKEVEPMGLALGLRLERVMGQT